MLFRVRRGQRAAALITLAALLLWPSLAHAASGDFNITTSPLPVLLATKPGTTTSTTLRVQNSGTTATRFKVELKKFRARGDTGKPLLVNRQPGDDYFDWVSFSKTSFEAEPGVWNEIGMTIKVPKDAAFGYYYAVLFSKEGANPKPQGNANTLTGAAAVLVLLDVQAPGEKKELKVTGFSSDHKLYEYLPADFKVTVHNSGVIHLSPAGNVFITRGGHKDIASLDVNPAAGNVLPNSSRTFNVSWGDGFPVFETKRDHGVVVTDKRGRPVRQLKWDFSHANRLRIGHYTAHLLLTYDNGSRDVPVEAEVSFWVVPWKAILAFIGLIVALWQLHRWSVRRAVRRHAAKPKTGGKNG
jgi:hypothetical protein